MSKPVKEMIVRDYKNRVGDLEDAMLISLRGISANDTNEIRQTLAKKEIRVTVIRNALFMKAFGDSKLAELSPLLTGSNALAYGAESVVEVAREIVELAKTFPGIELRGAVLDGELYAGEEGVTRLSKFPTREEAIAEDVTLILSPARNLMGAVKGPGSRLLGVIKAIEEKLEKGESIAKV
ncbi:MAG: 50S ribosomal protein L10 [Planctomycetota bacterium]|nr:MAG: 50S ribosomal protein L10 [Planctomycetota bacterium]